MTETLLPSRPDMTGHAVQDAITPGVLAIVNAYVYEDLKTDAEHREAIDYEAAIDPLRNWIEFMMATAPLEGSDAEWWDRNLLIGATLTVDAAIGKA